MDDTPIRVCATADTLTLYWDKPAGHRRTAVTRSAPGGAFR